MKKKPYFIFSFIIVCSVCFFLRFDFQKSMQKKSNLKNHSLLNCKKEEIRFIDVKKDQSDSGLFSLSIEKSKNNEWFIKNPIEYPADKFAVTRLIENICSYKYSKIIKKKSTNLADFGLLPAKTSFLLKDYNNREYKIFIGDNSKFTYGSYVDVGSEDEFYIGSQYISVVSKLSLFQLRSKKIFHFQKDNIADLRIYINGKKIFEYTKSMSDEDYDQYSDIVEILNQHRVSHFYNSFEKNRKRLGVDDFIEKVTVQVDEKSENKTYDFFVKPKKVFLHISKNDNLISVQRKQFYDLMVALKSHYRAN